MRQFFLLLSVSIIFIMGLLMIFSTTSAEILDHDLHKNTHQALLKQMYYGLAGVLLGLSAWKFGYKNMLKYSPQLLAFFTILLVLVLFGREVNGSKRWLHLFGFSFQPS